MSSALLFLSALLNEHDVHEPFSWWKHTFPAASVRVPLGNREHGETDSK